MSALYDSPAKYFTEKTPSTILDVYLQDLSFNVRVKEGIASRAVETTVETTICPNYGKLKQYAGI